jgi:hypothetical protein
MGIIILGSMLNIVETGIWWCTFGVLDFAFGGSKSWNTAFLSSHQALSGLHLWKISCRAGHTHLQHWHVRDRSQQNETSIMNNVSFIVLMPAASCKAHVYVYIYITHNTLFVDHDFPWKPCIFLVVKAQFSDTTKYVWSHYLYIDIYIYWSNSILHYNPITFH